jgi:hypothetical protein
LPFPNLPIGVRAPANTICDQEQGEDMVKLKTERQAQCDERVSSTFDGDDVEFFN